jgi:RHS repeat-associated protein
VTATAADERSPLPGPTWPPSAPPTSFPLADRRPVVLADDPCEAGFSGADPEYAGIYLHARYFDPKLGTFLSPDPIGVAGGMNLYGYGLGNPIGFSDRSGLVADANGCDGGAGVSYYLDGILQFPANVHCPGGGSGGGGWPVPGHSPATGPTWVPPVPQEPPDDPDRHGTEVPCTGPNCPKDDPPACKPGDPNCDKTACKPGDAGCDQKPPACQPGDPACTPPASNKGGANPVAFAHGVLNRANYYFNTPTRGSECAGDLVACRTRATIVGVTLHLECEIAVHHPYGWLGGALFCAGAVGGPEAAVDPDRICEERYKRCIESAVE